MRPRAFRSLIGVVLLSASIIATANADPVAALYDGQLGALVGGYREGNWLEAAKVAPLLKGGEVWTLYSEGKTTTAKGGAPKHLDTPFEDEFGVSIKAPAAFENALATTGVKDAIPRAPRSGSTTIPAYVDATKDFLAAAGLKKAEVKITQVIKVDLDGDGEDEAIVAATRYKKRTEDSPITDALAGDYSVVFLRKLIDGKVRTFPLVTEVYPKDAEFCAPNEHRIAGFLDINGDGVMEILVHSNYYEGASTAVFEYKKGKVSEVIGVGLGV